MTIHSHCSFTGWNESRKERTKLLKEIADHGVDSRCLQSSSIATSLFLVRVLTSLRVSTKALRPIKNHLRAIEKFFTTSSESWRLSRQFIETGGVRLIVEVLERLPSAECVRVLLALARLGRDAKEHICECDGVSVLVQALLVPGPREMDEPAGELLVELGYGNPSHEDSVRHGLLCLLAEDAPRAARALAARSMNAGISTDSPQYVPSSAATYPVAFVPNLLVLLVDADAQLCYQATVLFKNLLVVKGLQQHIVGGLVGVLNRRNTQGSRSGRDKSPGCSGLVQGKVAACEVLVHMLDSRDIAKLRETVALMVEKNVVRVLLRVVTENGPDLAEEINLFCCKLLSQLYDADDNHGVVQCMINDLLFPLQQQIALLNAGVHCRSISPEDPFRCDTTRLLPLLVCDPEAFHYEVMNSATLAAMMRREIARGRKDDDSALSAKRHGCSGRGSSSQQSATASFFMTGMEERSLGSPEFLAATPNASPETPSRISDDKVQPTPALARASKADEPTVIDLSRFKRKLRGRGERRITSQALDLHQQRKTQTRTSPPKSHRRRPDKRPNIAGRVLSVIGSVAPEHDLCKL